MSIPYSNTIGIKPKITDMPTEMRHGRFGMIMLSRRCCICGNIPTKIATYPIQNAVRIERTQKGRFLGL
jgi:hypothetical protein